MNQQNVHWWETRRWTEGNYEPHKHKMLLTISDTHCHHESERAHRDKQAEEANHKPCKNSTDHPVPPSTLQLKQILSASYIIKSDKSLY